MRIGYWKGSGEVRRDVLAPFIAANAVVLLFHQLEEAFQPDGGCDLLIVDGSGGESESSERIVELSLATSRLASLPVLFAAYHAHQRCAQLRRSLPKLTGLEIPCSSALLDRVLAEIHPELGEKIRAAAPVAKPEESVAVPSTRVEEVSPVVGDIAPSHIPSRYGGNILAMAMDHDQLNLEEMLPRGVLNEKTTAALAQFEKENESLSLHSKRVAILSALLSKSVDLPPERCVAVGTTALFLNWGLRSTPPQSALHDVLLAPHAQATQRVTTGYHDSARYIREDLANPESADIADAIGKMFELLGNSPPKLGLREQCVVGPELVQRSLFSGRRWNRYGLRRAIRKLSSGEVIPLEQNISEYLQKALAEAAGVRLLVAPEPILLYETVTKLDADLVSEAEADACAHYGGRITCAVDVSQLSPHTALARPLVTQDGVLVLRARTVLNPELIGALQRLAAVRPFLATPSVVSE